MYIYIYTHTHIHTFYKLLEMHMFRKNSDSTKRCKTKIKTIHSPFSLPQIMSVESLFFPPNKSFFTYDKKVRVQMVTSGGLVVKNQPANARDACSIPGSGRSPGEGHGNSAQYSCLGNPMNRGALWVTVYRVAKCQI